jgi:hypothetical protein
MHSSLASDPPASRQQRLAKTFRLPTPSAATAGTAPTSPLLFNDKITSSRRKASPRPPAKGIASCAPTRGEIRCPEPQPAHPPTTRVPRQALAKLIARRGAVIQVPSHSGQTTDPRLSSRTVPVHNEYALSTEYGPLCYFVGGRVQALSDENEWNSLRHY